MPEPLKQPEGPARRSVLFLIAIVGLVAVGALIAFKNFGRHEPPPPAAEATSAPVADHEALTRGTTAAQPATMAEARPRDEAPAVTSPPPPVTAPPAPPVVSGPAASGYTSQLVATLAQIDLSKGEITAEQAAAYTQSIRALVERGAESVPAIRDYLAKNVDLGFGSLKGGEQLGASSLRLSLIDALAAIGGPEAIALSAQTLQSTYDPREIAALAKGLESQAPEQYRQMAVDAARAALGVATTGKLEGRDVGPLFNVLAQYGGAAVINDLQGANSQWRYYSAIALGSLPEHAGVPALIQMADPKGPATGSRSIALQMLAQASAQSPEARAALLEQARADQISSAVWMTIGPLLEGHVMHIGKPGVDGNPDLGTQPEIKTYHLAVGNQDFFSAPGPPLPPEQVKWIDTLLSVTRNEAGVAALNRAKTGR